MKFQSKSVRAQKITQRELKTLNVGEPEVRPHLWILSGLDPWGASGLAIDLKMAGILRVHACPIVTSLTVQDLRSFGLNNPQDNPLFEEQIRMLHQSTKPYGIKVGMLGSKKLIDLLRGVLSSMSGSSVPVVLDPLTHTSSGYEILGPKARESMIKEIFPKIFLVTPNTREAEIFTGVLVDSQKGMEKAAGIFLEMGCSAVLIKGGHGGARSIKSSKILSLFASRHETFWIESKRRPFECRGTGCALSSLIAGLLCQAAYSGGDWKKTFSKEILQAFHYLDEAYLRAYHTTQTAPMDLNQPRILPCFPKRSEQPRGTEIDSHNVLFDSLGTTRILNHSTTSPNLEG